MEGNDDERIEKKIDKILKFLSMNDIVLRHITDGLNKIMFVKVSSDEPQELGSISYIPNTGIVTPSYKFLESTKEISDFYPELVSPITTMIRLLGDYNKPEFDIINGTSIAIENKYY